MASFPADNGTTAREEPILEVKSGGFGPGRQRLWGVSWRRDCWWCSPRDEGFRILLEDGEKQRWDGALV